MSAIIPKRITILATSFVMAMLLAVIAATPQEAQASELNAASLSVQSSATNTSMYKAKELSFGKGYIGTFDYDDEGEFEEYWFKFKTSNRRSVYETRVQSIDGSNVGFQVFNERGGRIDWGHSTSTTDYCTFDDGDKGVWYYCKVYRPILGASRYDQFKITFYEHPFIKQVTGLKATRIQSKSITLKWSKQANATKYQIKYRAKGGSWKTITSNKNSAKLKKLKKNTSYQVKVRAYCKGGYNSTTNKYSSWSSWSSVKTIRTKR